MSWLQEPRDLVSFSAYNKKNLEIAFQDCENL